MPTINLPPKKKNKTVDNNGNKKKRQKYYNLKVWAETRDNKLREQPLCEMCLNCINEKITPATQVHHIVSFMSVNDPAEQMKLFTEPSNLMSICDECHGLIHSKAQHNKTK